MGRVEWRGKAKEGEGRRGREKRKEQERGKRGMGNDREKYCGCSRMSISEKITMQSYKQVH